jgi:hypothetical protein
MTRSLSAELRDVFYDLGRCIEALGPYRKNAVLIGGLAALLYRWSFPTPEEDRPALMTFDIDWAVPERLGVVEGAGLHQRMEQGGFISLLRGEGKDPVTSYQHSRHGKERRAPIYAEFIAPRTGSKTDRDGINRAIIEVQPQLHAQTDPYLGLLLVENLVLDASTVPGMQLPRGCCIRLPHPICFIVQKLLIRRQRPPHKRANDAAHIYDVALLTREAWPRTAEVIARVKNGGQFPAAWFDRASETLRRVFVDTEAPGPDEIANIYRSIMSRTAAPTAEAISRVLTQFSETSGLLNH